MPNKLAIGVIFLILDSVVLAQDGADASSHQVSANKSESSAVGVARIFYSYITRHHFLGIPKGADLKALRPLMSKRLVQQLDTLQRCEDDYDRSNGQLLRNDRAIQTADGSAPLNSPPVIRKPTIGWLEDGLFSGGNEAATPSKFTILGSTSKGASQVDVRLRFTHKQTYCCGWRPQYSFYQGIVTLILEGGRFVVDDFVAVNGKPGRKLSEGFRDCDGSKWVARPEASY